MKTQDIIIIGAGVLLLGAVLLSRGQNKNQVTLADGSVMNYTPISQQKQGQVYASSEPNIIEKAITDTKAVIQSITSGTNVGQSFTVDYAQMQTEQYQNYAASQAALNKPAWIPRIY